jgi:hypothetical protein
MQKRSVTVAERSKACTVFFFLIRIVGGGVQAGSPRHVGHWMAYCTCPAWLWWWRIWWNEDWQGKPKYLEKTCPSATLYTTNPTWPDPGLNPGRHGGKPATNRLSYGAAMHCLSLLGNRDSGFESHSGHGCLVLVYMCVFLCLCLATNWSPAQVILPTV